MRKRNTSWGGVASWYGNEVGKSGHFHHENTILPAVLKILTDNEVHSVLDLGCGQGVLERSLAPEIDYFGVDIAPELISIAKKLSKRSPNNYLVFDAGRVITSVSRQFDAGVCMLALQNIENYQGVFRNFAKYVKDKGTLVLVLNHPYYRIPRSSGWDILAGNNKQIRWVSSYLREQRIPITMNPGQKQRSRQKLTWSFHVPLSKYIEELSKYGFAITHMEELASPKESVGKFANRENIAREEIPLFMILVAKRLY